MAAPRHARHAAGRGARRGRRDDAHLLARAGGGEALLRRCRHDVLLGVHDARLDAALSALLLGAEVAAVSETRTFPPEQDGGPAPLAQWVGLLLAPLVFAAHLQINYVL